MNMADPYKTLGVSREADQKEIKKLIDSLPRNTILTKIRMMRLQQKSSGKSAKHTKK